MSQQFSILAASVSKASLVPTSNETAPTSSNSTQTPSPGHDIVSHEVWVHHQEGVFCRPPRKALPPWPADRLPDASISLRSHSHETLKITTLRIRDPPQYCVPRFLDNIIHTWIAMDIHNGRWRCIVMGNLWQRRILPLLEGPVVPMGQPYGNLWNRRYGRIGMERLLAVVDAQEGTDPLLAEKNGKPAIAQEDPAIVLEKPAMESDTEEEKDKDKEKEKKEEQDVALDSDNMSSLTELEVQIVCPRFEGSRGVKRKRVYRHI
ncbi:hypothetical protein K505DRAFT_358481 [Melanomma pulvis-pyrius CBS 109.77]|uniref:Uncharacterized protein n=1 Tax=Melanomma pulvis-pyrius CBS 109.77 TaxID=1314802 RepID=A0A6A6XLC2_9PLEO|nr:hypothetical protein K505DRAFT_358481 [Melanomma pulvis-pyrius CBS 109.77]